MSRDQDAYPPLISPRSPSYERAWREFPQPGDTALAELVALFARLSEAEQNASSLCNRMLPALGDAELADVVRDHAGLHAARREALGKLIGRLGGSPPTDAECRVILSDASDAAQHVLSSADATRVLTQMRRELGAEYDAALQNPRLDETQRSALAALAPMQAPAY
jgi:hypothetical protein